MSLSIDLNRGTPSMTYLTRTNSDNKTETIELWRRRGFPLIEVYGGSGRQQITRPFIGTIGDYDITVEDLETWLDEQL